MFNLKFVLPICAVLFLVAGCSTVGRVNEVAGNQEQIKLVNRFTNSVSVTVSGGDERFVSSKVFSAALIKTIRDTRLFQSASTAKGGDYELSVVILSMSHPFLAFVANMSSLWTLRTPDGKELWSETIKASGHSSAFGGVQRIRASYEGAARAVIENGLSEVSALNIR